MSSKFNFLVRSSFLQNIASCLVSFINPVIIHNLEKYFTISKLFYYTAIEKIEGDYLEFGVYTGSSFSHAIRSYKKTLHYEEEDSYETKFFGFDSFEGFGEVTEEDHHPFFVKSNFTTDYEKVKKRISKIDNRIATTLIKGFYSDSLKNGAEAIGIKKARIIFVDCDTYTAAQDVFYFCKDVIQEGTVIVLDDYMCYRGAKTKGVSKAFYEFVEYAEIEVRNFSAYGVGAHVFIVSKVK